MESYVTPGIESENPQEVKTNINSDTIDEATANKLRGDAIGDTMYSESFVAKTLLQLKDFTWTKTLEDDLCFLWDATVEKDVCEYLFSVSYPALACATLTEHPQENRFVEIAVGILANMICAGCEERVSDAEVAAVLDVLSSDDPLILIQVVRFVKGLVYVTEDVSFVTKDVVGRFSFILVSCSNCELLSVTLDCLSHVLSDGKLSCDLISDDLFSVTLVAYKEICKKHKFSLDGREIQTALTFTLSILSSFSYYVNVSDDNRLLDNIKQCEDDFIIKIQEIFHFYEKEENLIPLSDTFKLYIEYLSYSLLVLNFRFDSETFSNYLKILNKLLLSNELEVSLFSELFCYYVTAGNKEQVLNVFEGSLKKNESFRLLMKFREFFQENDNVRFTYLIEALMKKKLKL